jgi:hypothetical protein
MGTLVRLYCGNYYCPHCGEYYLAIKLADCQLRCPDCLGDDGCHVALNEDDEDDEVVEEKLLKESEEEPQKTGAPPCTTSTK